jgi:hypothetical protein
MAGHLGQFRGIVQAFQRSLDPLEDGRDEASSPIKFLDP